MIRHFALLAMLIAIGGCDPTLPLEPSSPTSMPVSVQTAQASPELQGQAFRNLLQFEQHLDTVFVQADGMDSSESNLRAHSGNASLRLRGGSGTLHVKLSSLMGSDPFPGNWTLAGAYFYSELPAQITVSVIKDGQTISTHTVGLPAGRWGAAMADLSKLSAPPMVSEASGAPAARMAQLGEMPGNVPATANLELRFVISAASAIWCDDVLLVDNKQDLVGNSADPNGWSLQRNGFEYVCRAPGKYSVQFATADAEAAGWTIAEINPMRVRLTSNGKTQQVTIYADGRSYWDGQFKALAADLRDPIYAQQQQSPASIVMIAAQGRVDRRTDGDANNDGYNEARGSYQILAAAPRLELTIQPRSVPVYRPVLEIAKLPPGKAIVTVEGQLIDGTQRLDNGTLLVEIPAKIERSTNVTVHVE